jgi:hypothetical protein
VKRTARLILLALALALAVAGVWLVLVGSQETSTAPTARPPAATSAQATPRVAVPAVQKASGDTLDEEPGSAEDVEDSEEEEPEEEEPTGPCIQVEVMARGVPVPKAHVTAVRHEEEDSYSEMDALDTGEDGRGKAWCAPGTYMLAASAKGFAPTVLEITEPATGPAPVARFELKAGYTLSGRVLSKDSQEPVPEALVTLSPAQDFSFKDANMVIEETVVYSKAQGLFRAGDLAAGTYRVSVEAPGHSSKDTEVTIPRQEPLSIELNDTCHLEGQVVDAAGAPVPDAKIWTDGLGDSEDDDAARTDDQGRFSLEVDEGTYHLGASADGQTGLHQGAVTVVRGGLVDGLVIHLGPSGRVSGKVFTQSTQAPINQAEIALRIPGEPWIKSALSDTQGLFHLDALLPGTYTLSVYLEGEQLLTRDGLRVEAGQELSVELPVVPEASVEGHLTDGLGRPAQDAFVSAQRLDGTAAEKQRHAASSDEQGRYSVTGLSPGRYQLEARWNSSSKPISRELTVKEGEKAQADFTFPDAPGEVQGTVQRASGGLPQGSVVIAATAGDSSMIQMASMDEEGHFSFKLMPGTYTLKAEYTDTDDTGPPQSLSLEAGKLYPVRLTVPDSVTETSGLVLNSRGEPAAGASVTLSSDELFESEEADARGHFSMKSSLASAGTAVILHAESEAEEGQVTGVRAGSKGTVIRLLKAAALRGRVSAAAGPPVQGFELELVSTNPSVSVVGTRRPFAGDTFELVDLPLGELELLVRTLDGRCGKGTVQLQTGQTSTVELSVGQLGRVTGRLVNSAGEPRSGHLSVDGRTDQERQASADRDGRFELIALEPGPHVLEQGVHSIPVPFTLRAGEALDLGDIKNRVRPLFQE